MAKRKSKTRSSEGFVKEIIGILIIVLSLVGLFTNQVVGNLIKGLAIFLVGNAYFVLLGSLIGLGLYVIVKRKLPSFFKVKYIGLYILGLTALIMLTFELAALDTTAIFDSSFNHLKNAIAFKEIAIDGVIGGGVVGAACAYALKSLLGLTGLYIFTIGLLVVGIIVTFNVSLRDLIVLIINGFKSLGGLFVRTSDEEETVKDNEPESDEEDEPEKKVVTSMEELIKINDGTTVTSKPKEKTNVVRRTNTGYVLPSL